MDLGKTVECVERRREDRRTSGPIAKKVARAFAARRVFGVAYATTVAKRMKLDAPLIEIVLKVLSDRRYWCRRQL